MSFWAYVLTCLVACALGGTLFASDNQPASEASGLTIDHLEFPAGTRCTLDAAGKPAPFDIHIVLKNPTPSILNIWEPSRVEGSQCPELIFTSADGQQTTLLAADVPQIGPPFSAPISPHSTLSITRDLSKLTSDHPLAPGKYRLQVIYHNDTARIGPVGNVWTGSITSNSYPIEFVKPH